MIIFLNLFLLQNKIIKPPVNLNKNEINLTIEKINLNYIDPIDLQLLLKIIHNKQFSRYKK